VTIATIHPKTTSDTWHNKTILYGDVFDSTKGYPGEGPPDPPQLAHHKHTQGKQGPNRVTNANEKMSSCLKAWGKTACTAIGQMTTTGDDLFWDVQRPELKWDKLTGCIAHLNTRGWSHENELSRKATWEQLAHMGSLVVSLVDHRLTKARTRSLEYEVAERWIGTKKRSDRPLWIHAPAKTASIGGVSMGIHPALRRYAHKPIHDPRKWGRWAGIELKGRATQSRTGFVVLINTYGPVISKDYGSMWQTQFREMALLPEEDMENDPKEQYVHDLSIEIAKYKLLGAEVILIGDTNINYHKKEPIHREWNKHMQDLNMQNWMTAKWPELTNTLHTWQNGNSTSWIDHIWLPQTIVDDSLLTRAGIEQVGGMHNSDHSLIAAELNWSSLLGHTGIEADRYVDYPRFLQCTDKKKAEAYADLMLYRDTERYKTPGCKMLVMRVDTLIARARKAGRTGTQQE
jgi:hypothetical protein